MKLKGVCYDVGRVMMGRNWRPVFKTKIVHRELEIIKNDLHCNAVRICGLDVERLMVSADDALNQGLEVWFCPEMWDRNQENTLDYIAKAAASAEELRVQFNGRLVFSIGSELTLFMQGIIEGSNVIERLAHPSFRETIMSGKGNASLNAFLAKASSAVRHVFNGDVVYASVPFEKVDWSLFDMVCVDLYRGKPFMDRYNELIKRNFAFGKPVVNTEFGCCTFKGAEELGGRGWDIIDFSKTPPQLKGDYIYDQETQAREDAFLLRMLDDAGVYGAFVFTFVQPPPGTVDEAERQMMKEIKFDPDITSYSLVKSFEEGHYGTTYPDMTWEPKRSFWAVADYYARH
jgi:hypothetical protein